MALKSPLGFGMMRLPVKNGDPTDFDYEKLFPMVDAFIKAGYTYMTAWTEAAASPRPAICSTTRRSGSRTALM
ncbi:MAG: hypothetical protein IJV64_14300 [Oscillospiraceae bacterium]|nr:hypothetical protein [Oscillospiraceae bacterium]